MATPNEKRMLRKLKKSLRPPTDDELNWAIARWLFGQNAEKMLKYAPWSFLLVKLMWVKGEEPWEG